MKTIIVYYSLNDNTDFAVKQIAAKLDADLLRIAPEKAFPDSGFKKFFWGGKSAVMKEMPKLLPYTFDASQYDHVIFGTPVWASSFTPPIRTFIEENRAALKGKSISAVFCMGGSGDDKALRKLKAFLQTDTLKATVTLIDPKDHPTPETEQRIAEFCQKLQ